MIARVETARVGVRVSPFVTPDGVALAIEIGESVEAPPIGRTLAVRRDQVARAAEALARREIRDWFRRRRAHRPA